MLIRWCDFKHNTISINDSVENISNIMFTQSSVKEALDNLYVNIWDVFRNTNPRATSVGYCICRYINLVSSENEVCARINECININKRHSPEPRHLDSPRPAPYRKTSVGVWETLNGKPAGAEVLGNINTVLFDLGWELVALTGELRSIAST